MRAGGTLTGELWLTRVHSLRPGDCIRSLNWADGYYVGGEVLLVLEEPAREGQGFFSVKVQVPDDPKNWWIKSMIGDANVQLAARDAVREISVVASEPKRPRKSKPKKGQLKLFEDD